MNSKEITLGHEARLKIKAGIEKACAAVAPTLGAVGMTAIIDWEGLDPIVSDDGVTILKHLEFKDKYENIGLKMLRKAAIRTSSEGGDGTATTTVLTQAFVQEALKEIAENSSNIREVRERLEHGLVETLEALSKVKREVKKEDIERIATISSLDPEIAKLIAEIINEIGINGIVTVEKGAKIGYSREIVKGARFDRGLLSHYFMNDLEKEQCVLENPYIFLVDRKLSINEQIKTLMESITKTGNKSVLIIADDVDGLALASLSQASKTVRTMTDKGIMQGTWDIACVKNPYTGTRGKEFLADIAALTSATVVSEEAGMRLDEATVASCGIAERVIVTKDTCTIIGGNASEGLAARIKNVQTQIDETTSEYSKEMLEERLACLTGGIGVIRVGTYTDTDFNEKKLKFDNAINATQAALQEGILAGGGLALRNVAEKIEDVIFKKALLYPFMQMSINANFVADMTVDPDAQMMTDTIGWDFKNRKTVDMFEAGIIDPFKVTRLALESAVHIACKVITCNTVIVGEKQEK